MNDENAALRVELDLLKAICLEMARNWEGTARRKFEGAKLEESEMGRRLIEHGAACYLNCARELKEALEPVSPDSSATQ